MISNEDFILRTNTDQTIELNIIVPDHQFIPDGNKKVAY
jgi:hypothetical protein